MSQDANQRAAISIGEPMPLGWLDRISLPQLLLQAAQSTGEIIHLSPYLPPHLSPSSSTPSGTGLRTYAQSYARLLQQAQSVLQGLQLLAVQPSTPVIFQFSQSSDFLVAFWACVLGGFVPVPLPPVLNGTDPSKTKVLHHVIQNLQPPLILTDAALQPQLQQAMQSLAPQFAPQLAPELPAVMVLDTLTSHPPSTQFHPANLDDLALLLFTSGSTGQPKGVRLSSRNLLSSIYGMATVNQVTADAISLNWMPLEHVASLVMFHLTQVYAGCSQVQVANELILAEPLKWIELLDQYRVTHTWAPNFAYGLMIDRLMLPRSPAYTTGEPTWDLSCLRWMGNGAEAVVGKTTRRFLQLLAPWGLRDGVVSPGYGMSETCSGIVHSHDFYLGVSESPAEVSTPILDQPSNAQNQKSEDNNGNKNVNLDINTNNFVEVGTPIPGISLRIVDSMNQVVTEGTIGRLQVYGATVMQGYDQNPDLNQQVFTSDGWFDTGDLGYLRAGRLTITGRQKAMIIINGVNYYNHDIEVAVEELPDIAISFTAACAVRRPEDTTDRLAIFFSPLESKLNLEQAPEQAPKKTSEQVNERFNERATKQIIEQIKRIRRQVVQTIGIAPSYIIPVAPTEIPKTNLGKIQRGQLSQRFAAGEFDATLANLEALLSRQTITADHLPQSQLEQDLAQIWQRVLGLPCVGIHEHFFELGGTSLLLMQVLQQLQPQHPIISTVALFQYPTIAALAQYLSQPPSPTQPIHTTSQRPKGVINKRVINADIAVIGMACRFPGANSIEEFWQNLCHGIESISFFTDAEILASGVDPHLLQHPNYVKASPILNSPVEEFDAQFFGYSPKEASLLDPQQRLLLECAWEGLEDAGYNPLNYQGAIGLYAGASANTYLLNYVYPNRDRLDENDSLNVLTLSSQGGFQLTVANDKDYLTTRVSYKLNLTGPSVNVQTACSTSLVAVHLARQSLLNGECDIALAGGVSVHTPQKVGHLYQDGMILSPDGHCRAFDADAAGTIFGSGAGIVVLKRLDQAMADGDQVYAVIKGSAMGNDGGQKVGYLAPTSEGQARVATAALEIAAIDPATIGYVEAHGTGTHLGDPIEIAALTQAFRVWTSQRQFCAIGSVKTNVGHLNIASGIVGLIKTILCLHHRQIPPSLHFKTPNPQLDLGNSPFYVNTQLQNWVTSNHPPRASVNALGIGGTNVHVVLEAVEPAKQLESARELNVEDKQNNKQNNDQSNRQNKDTGALHLLTLSAKTEMALAALIQRYATFLTTHPEVNLADLCFTTQVGRAHFEHRLGIVAASVTELQQQLSLLQTGIASNPRQTRLSPTRQPRLAFWFPGQGCQYPGMGQALYKTCAAFRAAVDRCDVILQGLWEPSLLAVIESSSEQLDQTFYAQPALFAIEYGLAQMWMSWGIRPAAVMGHSMGEYVAACIAGVFSLEDALKLIVARGRLMQSLPSGAMVAVMASEHQVQFVLDHIDQVSIAAINGQEHVVIAGSPNAIEQAVAVLTTEGIKTTLLKTSHAFHSPLMAPILPEFEQVAQQVIYTPPQIPLISNLTGQVADATLASPHYWSQHLLQPVRFADGLKTLHQNGYEIFIECGTKPLLTGIAQANMLPNSLPLDTSASVSLYVQSLNPSQSDWRSLLNSLSHLYQRGITPDWHSFYRNQKHQRISLPSYPFQRQRYWLDREIPPSTANFPSSFLSYPHLQPATHPLLGGRFSTPLKQLLFQSQISCHRPEFLQDHQIYQSAIFPATAFLEMAIAATCLQSAQAAQITLQNVVISKALVLSENRMETLQCILEPIPGEDSCYGFRVYSSADELEEWVLHSSGTCCDGIRDDTSILGDLTANLEILQQSLQKSPQASAKEHYQRCQAQGFQYGESFQAVQQVWRRQGEALGRIQLPAPIASEATAYQLHPVLLDAAFQLISAVIPSHVSVPILPIALKQLWFFKRPASEYYWGYVQLHSPSVGSQDDLVNLQLFNSAGEMIVVIEQLRLRHTEQPQLQEILSQRANSPQPQDSQPQQPQWQDWLYEVEWQLQTASAQSSLSQGFSPSSFSSKTGGWLIFADQGGIAQQLVEQMSLLEQKCYLVFPNLISLDLVTLDNISFISQHQTSQHQTFQINPASLDNFQQLLSQIDLANLQGVIHLWSLDCIDLISGSDLQIAFAPIYQSALHLIQALGKLALPQPPRCWFVTAGVQAFEHRQSASTSPNLTPSCLWGLGKVIALEHPEFAPVCVDLDPEQLGQAASRLWTEIQANSAEAQIAFCGHQRYVARLVKSTLSHRPPSPSPLLSSLSPPFQSIRLSLSIPGSLDHLTWQPAPRRSPKPEEVEIRVYATGLNFRDVLQTLNLYSDEKSDPVLQLGLECTGEVVAIGTAVTQLAVGDRVLAIAVGSFSQYVTVNVALVAPLPPTLSFTDAATLPTAFLTADYALRQLAQIQPGERVLIHAASGGVGQAAIQIAQQAGAEIFATASPGKWERLKAQGIQHLFNSRSVSFANAILDITQNVGVDIVLNSLTGEFIPASFSTLRSGGRFVEIGKARIWTAEQIAALRPDLSYFQVDLVELTQRQPDQIQALLRGLMPQFQSGRLQPLPQTCFPAAQTIAAFRLMQQAKHFGKIVVTQSPLPASLPTQPIHLQGTYLITGGTGSLGLQVAEWLVSQGATHLILVARHAPTGTAQAAIQALQLQATVDLLFTDIAAAEILPQIRSLARPLRGIIHAAGILDDGILQHQTWERFTAVMAAKVQGAWNLHCLAQDLQAQGAPIDHFVLFSSAATLLGSAGQANYAAANAFLDALAHYRRSLGLPALSLNWGAWSQVGMAARRETPPFQPGIEDISPDQGLAVLAHLLPLPVAQVGVLPLKRLTWNAPAFPFFSAVNLPAAPSQPCAPDFLSQWRRAAAAERSTLLFSYLRTQISRILGVEAATIDPQQGLSELGMDSLTAVELRNLFQKHWGGSLPSTLLFDYPTLAALATYLEQLYAPPSAEAQPAEPQPAEAQSYDGVQPTGVGSGEALLEQSIEQMSEEAAVAQLLRELDRLGE